MNRVNIAAAAAALLILGCAGEETESLPRKVVGTITVDPAPITQEVYRSARLEGVEEAIIIPAVGGRIEEVLVMEGDSVREGDPLVRLVTDRQISAGTSAAVAGINAARANNENAARNAERVRVLYEAGAVSEAELEGAQAMAEAAAAQLVQAQAGYRQAASLADNSYVNSPFTGVVGRVWAREGNMAGGSPLLSVSNSSTVIAEVLLPEKYLGEVEPGDPARAEVLTGDRINYPGVVTAASQSVDAVSGMVAVRVSFDNEGRLHSGQSARIAIGVRTSTDALSVPETALIREVDGYSLAVEKNGTVSIARVETGIRNMGFVEITSGLEPGDRVIVSGQHLVADGEEVEVLE